MGSLFGALTTVARSMQTMQKGLEVVSNNVTNAKTPGFVKQSLELIAQPFSVEMALTGGISAGDLLSSRNAFLERGVWTQAQTQARYEETSRALAGIEIEFDISKQNGLSS
jgi:flagellar hook-associated protein FlgK